MDAAVKSRDLEMFTAMAGGHGKCNEQHSKVGPRDMLASLKKKRERGRETVLGVEAEEWLSYMWSQCIGWPVQVVKL